jgi:hypothetical protein
MLLLLLLATPRLRHCQTQLYLLLYGMLCLLLYGMLYLLLYGMLCLLLYGIARDATEQ